MYWSYGDYKTEQNVDSTTNCCKLCKEDADCTNFSYGKVGKGYAKQCFLKRGGNEQSRGEFISSPNDISGCECGTGRHHTSF